MYKIMMIMYFMKFPKLWYYEIPQIMVLWIVDVGHVFEKVMLR